jgi:hypothetical protein
MAKEDHARFFHHFISDNTNIYSRWLPLLKIKISSNG